MYPSIPSHVFESVQQLNVQLNTGVSLPELPDILNRTVLAGGKKLRPMLCFLMGELFGVPAERLAPFARVAELLHCATLAHDDVIDGADQRRRRPTLNSATSNSRAVLAGDLLLARVITELSDLGNLQIMRELSLALEELVNGEWLQMGARGNIDTTRAHLEKVARMKTSSLMAWCCVVPAHLSDAEPRIREACRRFGERIGLAFQMKDDLLDFKPNAEKPFAQDLREGLVNFLTRELLDAYPELEPRIVALLGTHPDCWPWTESQLATAGERLSLRIFRTLEGARADLAEIAASLPPDRESALQSLTSVLQFVGVREN